MNIKKITGIILILLGLSGSAKGIQIVSDNSASVKIGKLDLDVSNKSGQQEGILVLGVSIILLGGGIYLVSKG